MRRVLLLVGLLLVPVAVAGDPVGAHINVYMSCPSWSGCESGRFVVAVACADGPGAMALAWFDLFNAQPGGDARALSATDDPSCAWRATVSQSVSGVLDASCIYAHGAVVATGADEDESFSCGPLGN